MFDPCMLTTKCVIVNS